MTFSELQNGLKEAMKARDTLRKEAVQTLIASVKKAAIDGGTRDNITEELVDSVILKELKIAKEQIDTCPADAAEQLEEYKYKYDVISSYAPKQMSEDEVRSYITEKFSALIAEGNKGVYMKTIMADMKGKADGKLINRIISEIAAK